MGGGGGRKINQPQVANSLHISLLPRSSNRTKSESAITLATWRLAASHLGVPNSGHVLGRSVSECVCACECACVCMHTYQGGMWVIQLLRHCTSQWLLGDQNVKSYAYCHWKPEVAFFDTLDQGSVNYNPNTKSDLLPVSASS